MKKPLISPKLLFSFIAGIGLLLSMQVAHAQSGNQGSIRIIDMEGDDISITNNATGGSITASEDGMFNGGHTIRTGPNSSVILILSNGATLFIGPDSTVNIATFEQTMTEDAADARKRPLNELDREIGISNLDIQIMRGVLYLDTQPMNQGSKITVRDENVVTSPNPAGGSYAQYYMNARGRSVVEVVDGQATTQGTSETFSTERDIGVYVFQNGRHDDQLAGSFTESIINTAFLSRISAAQGSAFDSDSATAPAPDSDRNNIKNVRTITNPVTGEEVFNPNTPVTPPSNDIISIIE